MLPIFLQDLLDGNLDLKAFRRNFVIRPLRVEIFSQKGETLYLIRPPGSDASAPAILLECAATAFQIVASGWGESFAHLIRNLAARLHQNIIKGTLIFSPIREVG